jgi:hypothetical protein
VKRLLWIVTWPLRALVTRVFRLLSGNSKAVN